MTPQQRYERTPKGKATKSRYQKSRKGREAMKRYRDSALGKVTKHLQNTSPEYRFRNRIRMQELRSGNTRCSL